MSLPVRTSQRHRVTQAIVGLPTDQLRECRDLSSFLGLALGQIANDQNLSLSVAEQTPQSSALSPGQCSDYATTFTDSGMFLRFSGSGRGTLYVHGDNLWYPVGKLLNGSWAYIPPEKYFCFDVDRDASGNLMLEAVFTTPVST